MLVEAKASTAISPRAEVIGAPEQRSAIVRATDIVLDYSGKRTLDRVSISIHQNEIVTLIGPNGAGKTTFARVLLGLVSPKTGTVWRRAGLRIGYVPQRFPIERIIPLSVRRFMSLNAPVPEAFALQCLTETGAESLLDAQMAQLSGGEFQRVLLARALARNADLLVLDEPAQAVDFAGAAKLYDLINTIRNTRRCGVLLISHDLHVVLGSSDRVVCLNRHICCEGVPGTIATHPEYIRLFGREAAGSVGLYHHSHDHTHTLSGDIA